MVGGGVEWLGTVAAALGRLLCSLPSHVLVGYCTRGITRFVVCSFFRTTVNVEITSIKAIISERLSRKVASFHIKTQQNKHTASSPHM